MRTRSINILGFLFDIDQYFWPQKLPFIGTMSYAVLRAADLDWIVRPGYSLGGYTLGCSQRLALCLLHSAGIGPDLLCLEVMIFSTAGALVVVTV